MALSGSFPALALVTIRGGGFPETVMDAPYAIHGIRKSKHIRFKNFPHIRNFYK